MTDPDMNSGGQVDSDQQVIGRDHISGLAVPEGLKAAPIFPFTGDLGVHTLRPFSDTEPPRFGDPGGPPCECSDKAQAENDWPAVWSNERWVVRPIKFGRHRAPFPSYMLGTVEHMDFEDLDDEMAAEYGVMCVRLDRAIRSIGDIARVHMNRWGDGGSHFHVWFLARPFGAEQLRGFTMPLWGFILPSLAPEVHRENDAIVAAALAASEPNT